MPQDFIIPPQQCKIQVLACSTGFILKTKAILTVMAVEKDTCCLSVVDALMADCQSKVRMARPGPFYTGTS